MRLPAHLHIKESRDFGQMKSLGQSHPGRFMVLSVLHEPELNGFRFGLIASRKVGKAVTRVRIRRLLREVVRAQQGRIKPGTKMILIARWRAPEATLDELQQDWLKIARRANILNPPPQSP